MGCLLQTGNRNTTIILYVIVVLFLYKFMLLQSTDNVNTNTKKLTENRSKSGEEKYSNFYLEGSQNIDLKDFKLVINNDVCGDDDVKIITIVTTALWNDDYRDVIRKSWGSPQIPGVITRLAFMIGYPPNEEDQQKIEKENEMYGDLVQGNFLDTYRNLTYKTVLGHMWVSSFCSQAEFVVKTDDEIYVDIYGMYALTRKFVRSRKYRENAFMMGVVNRYWKRVVRDTDDELAKWYVSYKEYPRDEKKFPGDTKEVYPDYIIGWFLVVTPGTSKRIVEASKTLSYIHVEDVWVTGILRERLNISLIDARWMRGFTSLKDLLMIKTVQNRNMYVRDYVTAMPIERNITTYRTCYMLEQEARRCYIEKCLSNIYHPDMWISKPNLEREFKIKTLASIGETNHVDNLNICAQNVEESDQNSYRKCSQQFLSRLVNNSLHHDHSNMLEWLKG